MRNFEAQWTGIELQPSWAGLDNLIKESQTRCSQSRCAECWANVACTHHKPRRGEASHD